jgi:hypothetical protein
MTRYLAWVVAVSCLATACSILEDDVEKGYAQSGLLAPATFTTADVRMITQRPRTGEIVVCTEPSPDVAKALSAAAEAIGSAANKGSIGLGGASAESVLALAGRSTALLGLRDGLYRACEAYANGAIGSDAYALILSRYGQLMTTVFLAQDVTGAAGTTTGGSIQSPPVSVTLNSSGSSTVSTSTNPSSGPATPTTPGTSPQRNRPRRRPQIQLGDLRRHP